MPVGLSGIVLAAIFAVAMSNASGSLNSLASSSVLDFSKRARKDAADPDPGGRAGALLQRSRGMTLLWGVVLGAFGLVHWGPVLVAGLTIASITYGGLLGTFLLGIYNRSANSTGAIAGMISGIAIMIGVQAFTHLAWTWFVLTGTIATFAVGSLVSWTSSRRQV